MYPENCTSDETQIPVLSPLGAALIGLKVGSHMPFFAAECIHIVRVERVSEQSRMLFRCCFARPCIRTKSSSMTNEDQRRVSTRRECND